MADTHETYKAAAARLGGAIEALERHDGWQIFLGLFHRRKQEIYSRSDYETLDEFKGDRKAIEIVQGIIEEMMTFKEDAEALTHALSTMNQGEEVPRGIMLIEAVEGENQEG
jgi:hypothetical protein